MHLTNITKEKTHIMLVFLFGIFIFLFLGLANPQYLLAEEIEITEEEIVVEEEDLSYKEQLHRDKQLLKQLQIEQKRRDKGYVLEAKEEERRMQSQVSLLIKEMKSFYSKKEYDQAMEKCHGILDIDPQNRTALNFIKLIRIKRDAQKEISLKRKADKVYKEAIHAYKKKDYEIAKEKFLQANDLITDYKNANVYLDKIEKNIQRERYRKRELSLELEETSIKRSKEKEEEIVEEEVEIDVEQDIEVVEKDKEVIVRQEEKVEIVEEEEVAKPPDEPKEEVVLTEKEKAQQRKKTINSLIKEAKSLYNNKLYNASKEKFEEVLTIDGANRTASHYVGLIDKKIAQQRKDPLEGRAAELYQAAIIDYINKDYDSAREKFIELDGFYPDYKKTIYYLKKIDAIIEKEQARKEALLKKEERRRKEKKIDAIISQARSFYNNKEYEKAQDEFNKVLEIDEKNRDAIRFLKLIRMKIREKELAPVREKAKEIYMEAIKIYKTRDYEAAKIKFEEVNELYPNYEKTDKYLKIIEKRIQKKTPKPITKEKKPKTEAQQSQKENKKELLTKAKPIYNEAVKAYKSKDYTSARDKFLEVNDIYFGYKKTNYYLDKIEESLIKELDSKVKNKQEKLEQEEASQRVRELKAQQKERKRYERQFNEEVEKLEEQWEREFIGKEEKQRRQEAQERKPAIKEEVTEEIDIKVTQPVVEEELIEEKVVEKIQIKEKEKEDIGLEQVKENIEKAKERYQEAGVLLEEIEQELGGVGAEEIEPKKIPPATEIDIDVSQDRTTELYEIKERVEKAKARYQEAARIIDELDEQLTEVEMDTEEPEELEIEEIIEEDTVEIYDEGSSIYNVRYQIEKTKEAYEEVDRILDELDEELEEINK